jgi:hypothetical protein
MIVSPRTETQLGDVLLEKECKKENAKKNNAAGFGCVVSTLYNSRKEFLKMYNNKKTRRELAGVVYVVTRYIDIDFLSIFLPLAMWIVVFRRPIVIVCLQTRFTMPADFFGLLLMDL